MLPMLLVAAHCLLVPAYMRVRGSISTRVAKQCLTSMSCLLSMCADHRALADELLVEKERVRNLTAEIEQTVQEIQGS